MESNKFEKHAPSFGEVKSAVQNTIMRHPKLGDSEKILLVRHLALITSSDLNSALVAEHGLKTMLVAALIRSVAASTRDQNLMDSLKENLSLTFPAVPGGTYEIPA